MDSSSGVGDAAVPLVDLPRDLKETSLSPELVRTQWALDGPRGQSATVDLPAVAAAFAALIFKYTQQEVSVGVADTGDWRILSTSNAGEESLSSLQDRARERLGSSVQVPVNVRRSLQLAVAKTPALLDAGALPALEVGVAMAEGHVVWVYRRDMFSERWMQRAHDSMVKLMRSELRTKLVDMRLCSEEEEALVLHTFNRTTVQPPKATSVLAAVAAAAKTHANRIAVDVGTQKVTYAELWAMAGRFGAALAKAHGPNGSGARPIAVLLDRGLFMIASLLAVWRSGFACMPLDVRTPSGRLLEMLADAEVQIAVSRASLRESMSWLTCTVVIADEYLEMPASKDAEQLKEPQLSLSDIAYVLFTSGSTGKPKGVMLTHGNLLAYIGWHIPYYALTAEDAVPHLAGLSFDASMAEIWPTLCMGGRVLPALDDNIRLIPEALCRWFADAGVTVAFLTTQLAETVLVEPSFPSHMKLRILFTGGDKLHFGPSPKAPFKLVNIYGPTECTVNVTMCSVPTGSGPPPIGEPVPGSQIYVLDPQLRPQPRGIYGELFIGGPQVGPGYLARPELTAEKFVSNPFAGLEAPPNTVGLSRWPTGPSYDQRSGPAVPEGKSAQMNDGVSVRSLPHARADHGAKLYRTGDLVRWDEDGAIDFLGRADCQVKIRGQRIELGEIEVKLLQHDMVKECCVLCREVALGGAADKYLAAYWAPSSDCTPAKEEQGETEKLREWLRSSLPEYMVPSAFMKLPKLPVNANGKVDRKNLPEPTFAPEVKHEEEEEVKPKDALEKQLQDIFDDVLGCSNASVTRSFFQLGGHSLSVGRLVNRLRREFACTLQIRDIYNSPSIRDLGVLLTNSGVSSNDASAKIPNGGRVNTVDLDPVYDASFQQKALFEMSELGPEASQALNITFACQVRGPLDVERLKKAFQAVSARHDALRSTFQDDPAHVEGSSSFGDSQLKCKVEDMTCLNFEVSDKPTELTEWILDEQYKTFDLRAGPLCRVRVLNQAPDAWVLHWTLHHTAADLWSYTVLLKDLECSYKQLSQASSVSWPSAAPQYRECAQEQAAWLASELGQESMQYWIQKLSPAPPALELPTDQKPKAGQGLNFQGSKVDFEFPASLFAAIEEVGRRCGATSAYPVLLAAWMALLSRHGQEEDVCVGIPMACRTTSHSEQAVGYFVNPVCVRALVTGTFDALVTAVSDDVRDVLQHQCVPLATVCEKLGLTERKLLQAMFVYQTSPDPALASILPSFFMGHAGSQLQFGDDLRFESLDLGQRHAQFDIALMLAPGPKNMLIGSFQYSSAHFSRAVVLQLQAQYQRLLEAVVKEHRQPIDTIHLFGDAEIQLLQRRAVTPWPQDAPQEVLPALLVAQARERPAGIAVIGPDGTITYGGLLQRAEQLADALLSGEQPAGRPAEGQNPLVGMMVSPGSWMVAGPLGAWLAGRGYFPIDPGHPIERIQQMVQDAEPQCIFCQRAHQSTAIALGHPVLVAEEIRTSNMPRAMGSARDWSASLPRPRDRGFLVFTSGSTGKPKAVVLSFASVLYHALFTGRHCKLKPGQAVLQHTSWTFDAHICEIYPALLQGGCVVISKRDGSKDFKYISELMDEHRVCHALFVPSLLAEILDNTQMPRSVRSVVTAGEATSLSLAARILEAPLTLHNFYGPSEGGIGATIYDIDKIRDMPANAQSTPIGRPVAWHQVVILDAKLRPAVGRAGQMAIMGEGLASGYLKLPEETAKKFLDTPQALRDLLPQCGPKIYLTGDVGRYVQDDLLEFVGRLDNQVKLRGQRIELGEIEAALLSLPVVTEAVCMVRADRLIAYFSTLHGVEEGDAMSQCTERTRERLPRYMWPELVHIVEWPRGRTGKVDRKALPMPQERQEDIVAPRTELEAHLLKLFCQVLKRSETSTSVVADFFSLGGTSLRAASLLTLLRTQVREASGLQFGELYAHPSPAALAALFASGREDVKLGPAPTEGFLPASYGQEHMLVLQELNPSSGAYNSALVLRMVGELDRHALAIAVEHVVKRHDVLRSNLDRDEVDGKSCVVQLTTPANEFACKMEYWPPHREDGTIPAREPLKPRRKKPRAFSMASLISRPAPTDPATFQTLSTAHGAPGQPASFAPRSGTFDVGRAPGESFGFRRNSKDSLRPARESSATNMDRYASVGYMGYSSPPSVSPMCSQAQLVPSRRRGTSDFEIFLEVDDGASPADMASEASQSRIIGLSGLGEDWRARASSGGEELASRTASTGHGMTSVLQRLADAAELPFDLRDDPLIRVVLASVNSMCHFLLITFHHAVTDGRSTDVLRKELCEAYNAALQGRAPTLPRLPLQYADVSYWQRQRMAQGQADKQLAYWQQHLEGLEPLNLPCDFQRQAEPSLKGAQVPVLIDAAVARRLHTLVRAHGVTLFAALLSAFAATLGRHGGSTDVAIASPVGNRDGPEIEQLIGYFVNTVIFRLRFPNSTYEQLLKQAKDVITGAFSNAEVPYASVLEAAKLDPSVVSAMFALQDTDIGSWSMNGLQVEMVDLPRRAALFDVVLELWEQGPGEIGGLLVYNTSLWTEERAQRFVGSFLELVTSMVAEPAVELPLLSAAPQADRVQLLQFGNHGQRPTPVPSCVEALQATLVRHWGRPAIQHGSVEVSYAEFGARVAALADFLRSQQEFKAASESGKELIVGVLLARCVELAVGIWAVLGAGAAYVPIDPEYPEQRIGHILANANPQLILCRAEHKHLAADVLAVTVDTWPAPETAPMDDDAQAQQAEKAAGALRKVEPGQLAYIIYTSGTTGRPKGVAVEHRAAANMVHEQVRLMKITHTDRVLQFFKPAFDGAVQEYLSTPAAGASLILWNPDESFSDVMRDMRVTIATLTPSALAVLQPEKLPALSQIATAAEACPPALIATWSMEGRRIVNAYGPSENTVVSTYADLDASVNVAPIGRPLEGVSCYVCEATRCRSLQPIGVPGELCIGGVQLARGYYRDRARTEEKFVANHLDGSRMYRSGDVVSWLPNGQLLYIGRNDEMVKVRGFRVELTEVESALAAAGAATVTVGLNKTKDALWAWCTLAPNATLAHMNEQLQVTLPQYMIPQRIFVLDNLPLTANGKIDKRRLLEESSAAPQDDGGEADEAYVAPKEGLEERVCGIAMNVLNLERLSATVELKSAGMSSLKQVLLSQKLRDAGFDVPLSMLYELKTVRLITEWLTADQGIVAVGVGADQAAENSSGDGCKSLCTCISGLVSATALLTIRLAAWCWISGVVIWPAVAPLWLASNVVLPHGGIWAALAWIIVVAYPLYMVGVLLLVVASKWLIVGRYRATSVPVNSCMFLRWWVVDRLFAFTSEMVLSPLRGSPIYFGYLRLLGLRAKGYCRIDTKSISEFDLIELGHECVIAEGAKLRPALIEAGLLHMRSIVLGDGCAVGENSVCTAGAVAGDNVTLQPLSFFSGRIGRTLPDNSVWKGAPLVQSRQQRIQMPKGIFANDLGPVSIGLLASLTLLVICSAVAYIVFGLLASVQGLTWRDAEGDCVEWQWQSMPEGWLFAAVWLLYGPPVMASADVLLGYDLAKYADAVADCLGEEQWVFGLRITGMIVLSYAVYGWALTLLSGFVCRFIRGSRGRNACFFQVRKVVLRMVFPRYPAQFSGTGAMAFYMKLLGGKVSLQATLAFADPPLEPRKLHIEEDAMVLNAVALGECHVHRRAFVGGGAVMLPYAEVEQHAIVGGNSVVGRPVHSGLVLASNPGVIAPRSELSKPPRLPSWATRWSRRVLRCSYPVLAPMVLQAFLLITLLPAMYVLTVLLNAWATQHSDGTGFLLLCLALSPVYVVLGLTLCLVAWALKWILLGRMGAAARWQWFGSNHSYVVAFVQSLCGMASGVFMGMAYGSPVYNTWLRMLGTRIGDNAIVMSQIMDFDCVEIGKEAVVDREAVVTGQRMLPAPGGPAEFALCSSNVKVGPRSTISVAATVAAAETAELSVLAPLSGLGASMKLPTRTLAVGTPPQKFVWSKERDNLFKPSAKPLPRELGQEIFLPHYVRRALSRMKVRSQPAETTVEQPVALVTGAAGFLGRYIAAALLESTTYQVVCMVRAADDEKAHQRVLASLKKAGIQNEDVTKRVRGICGDLSQRHFGLSLSAFQNLAGQATHVFNSAAKVNLAEPFQSMCKDNVDATAHIIEFCCTGKNKQLNHVSTMGVLTPDMLNRRGKVLETAPLGDMRGMPLYGTGDQSNGYPYTKWCAERMVYEAGQSGLQVFVHRAGLIGGHSKSGALAEDVFFHFLSDVVKLRELPDMEGDKFNITPVDWVARAIVHVATTPSFSRYAGGAVHPAASGNTVTVLQLAEVLRSTGYDDPQHPLRWVNFWDWRAKIIADPEQFKSWSFCAALSVEGNGIDSMAGNHIGVQAMREAVGPEVDEIDPRENLERMIAFCQQAGLLPRPRHAPAQQESFQIEDPTQANDAVASSFHRSNRGKDMAVPLLTSSVSTGQGSGVSHSGGR